MQTEQTKNEIKKILEWVISEIDLAIDTNPYHLVIGTINIITENFRKLIYSQDEPERYNIGQMIESEKNTLWLDFYNNLSDEKKKKYEIQEII